MENKVTRTFTTLNLDELDYMKKVVEAKQHNLIISNNILHSIKEAIFELEQKGVYKTYIRITTNKLFYNMFKSYLQEEWYNLKEGSNYKPMSPEIMGIQVNTEHPYMELVVHHIDSAIYPELLIKINIDYGK